MAFTPLGDTLKNKMGSGSPLKNQLESTEIVELAQDVLKDIFGEELGMQAKPLFLKNRTLTVSCASSAIAQEIRLNQLDIVEKINKKLGEKQVDRIRYLA